MNGIAVIVHVYYAELWPELAACIRNIDEPHSLFVTYSSEDAVRQARIDFPEAKFVPCENRGFDVWPFVKVLQTLSPQDYRLVVKLHTKRDVDDGLRYEFNHVRLYGAAWRNHLLSFVKTRNAWRRTLRLLSRANVGMVADRHLVMRRCDVPFERAERSFDAAARFMGLGEPTARRSGQYVAGTMFAARLEALAPLLCKKIVAGDFETSRGHEAETFAHVLERALGFSVSMAGFRLVAFNGSLRLRRLLFAFRRGRPNR